MNLQIAENLRRLRQERNMTQAELAERLGVSYQAVSRWENKGSYPDIELLPSLAALFGVTVDYLLGNAERRAGRAFWDRLYSMEGDAERIAYLRETHRAYPEDMEVFFRLCEALWEPEECRRLTEEFLAVCSIPFLRERAIKHVIFVLDEEHVLPYMWEKNIPEEAWDELLEERYLVRGETGKHREKRQWLLREYLRQAFIRLSGPGINELCTDPAEGVLGARTVLSLIEVLTDSRLPPEHPVAGDGGPDLWYHERIWAGITLACAEAAAGNGDAAMRYLTDAADLISRVRSLSKDTVLSHRTPEMDTLDRPRARCATRYSEDMERAFAHPAFEYLRKDPLYTARFQLCRRVFLSAEGDGR